MTPLLLPVGMQRLDHVLIEKNTNLATTLKDTAHNRVIVPNGDAIGLVQYHGPLEIREHDLHEDSGWLPIKHLKLI